MALWYEPLEIADAEGKATGRWRYTYRSDESMPKFPVPLCRCAGGHLTAQAARACPEVQRSLPPELRVQPDDPQDVSWS
jgi:hypothetical protein